MDAAGPLFEKTTKDVRIDKSDASFVDLIHSNGGNEDKEGLQIIRFFFLLLFNPHIVGVLTLIIQNWLTSRLSPNISNHNSNMLFLRNDFSEIFEDFC